MPWCPLWDWPADRLSSGFGRAARPAGQWAGTDGQRRHEYFFIDAENHWDSFHRAVGWGQPQGQRDYRIAVEMRRYCT